VRAVAVAGNSVIPYRVAEADFLSFNILEVSGEVNVFISA